MRNILLLLILQVSYLSTTNIDSFKFNGQKELNFFKALYSANLVIGNNKNIKKQNSSFELDDWIAEFLSTALNDKNYSEKISTFKTISLNRFRLLALLPRSPPFSS